MSHYQIHAIRYATDPARQRGQNFDDADPARSQSMPMDYFVWAIVGETGTFIVDTGFDATTASRRQRVLTRPVEAGLAQVGVNPGAVKDVILTHLHHDHAGNRGVFAHACHHVQQAEMAFCTGTCMVDEHTRNAYEVEDVKDLVGSVFAGQVRFHGGANEIADGISVHLVGGHTDGLQVVRVRTARGHVVLASDAAHYYEHLHAGRVFPLYADRAAVLAGYSSLSNLASSPDHIIPGHDPSVLTKYRASLSGIDDIVRLDLPPLTASLLP